MPSFSNTITLVQILDGAPGTPGVPGKGIKKIQVLYAVSDNGIQPPADKIVDYAVENNVLTSSEPTNTFRVDSFGVLYFIREQEDRIGVVDREDILKIESGTWVDTLPVVSEGSYLWIKTITTYTDDEVVITYQTSKVGKDGITYYTWIKYADDDKGTNMSDNPEGKNYMGIAYNKKESTESTDYRDYTWSLIKGEDANSYYIETNQEEILRFIGEEGKEEYSPSSLSFKIFHAPKQNDNDEELQLKDKDSYRFEYYDNNSNKFVQIEENGIYLTRGFQATNNGGLVTYEENTVYFYTEIFYQQSVSPSPQNGQIFRFSYLIDGQVAGTKIIEMRNGVTEDMASFNIHAHDINMAIQETKLNFSADGLTITNGGLRIFNRDSQSYSQTTDSAPNASKIYYFKENGRYKEATFTETESGPIFTSGKDYYELKNNDPSLYTENGDLILKGTVYATDGKFTGIIEAEDGDIGGFLIKNDRLISEAEINGKPVIELIAKTGEEEESKIIARNIELGGATILDSIQIGEHTFITNPSDFDKTILTSGINKDFVLSLNENNNPILKIGNITLNGETSSINISTGKWNINGETGQAIFDNVVLNTATIGTTILEANTIQAVGGSMIFKNTAKVTSINKSDDDKAIITIDKENILESGDWVYISCGAKKTLAKVILEEGNIKLNINLSDEYIEDETILTLLGNANSDYVFSITSENNTNSIPGFMHPQSLTLAKLVSDSANKNLNYEKILILGNLDGLGSNISGHGLYAENVFLTGSLTTQTTGGLYAGVNTLSGVSSTKTENDKTNIVFWAGSQDSTTSAIQNALFQVTEAGSLYAANGYFTGSIIANSSIKASDIHVANIYGPENADGSSAGALNIYDANAGICFYTKGSPNKEVLRLTSGGFSIDAGKNRFIEFSNANDKTDIVGYFSSISFPAEEEGITINNSGIQWKEGKKQIKFTNNDSIEFLRSGTKSDISQMEIKTGVIALKEKETNIKENLVIGGQINESPHYLNYIKETQGYNLYIQ